MSTPSPSEPRPPEKLPTLPANEPAKADGELAANDKLSGKQPTNLTTHIPRGGTVGREWSSYPELRESDLRLSPRRRLMLPLVLFVATCLSTFWVGAANWRPQLVETAADIQTKVAANWQQGLLYMGAVLAILLTHEMGHFLQTVRYRIPASYPLCIPVPFTPIGTMGAVISMDGMRANRKQIFDIGHRRTVGGTRGGGANSLHRREKSQPGAASGAGRYAALQPSDRAVDDRVDPPGMGRTGGLGFGFAAQPIFYGGLGRNAHHRAEYATRESARRRPHDLWIVRP